LTVTLRTLWRNPYHLAINWDFLWFIHQREEDKHLFALIRNVYSWVRTTRRYERTAYRLHKRTARSLMVSDSMPCLFSSPTTATSLLTDSFATRLKCAQRPLSVNPLSQH
jgi:hypothetical protein